MAACPGLSRRRGSRRHGEGEAELFLERPARAGVFRHPPRHDGGGSHSHPFVERRNPVRDGEVDSPGYVLGGRSRGNERDHLRLGEHRAHGANRHRPAGQEGAGPHLLQVHFERARHDLQEPPGTRRALVVHREVGHFAVRGQADDLAVLALGNRWRAPRAWHVISVTAKSADAALSLPYPVETVNTTAEGDASAPARARENASSQAFIAEAPVATMDEPAISPLRSSRTTSVESDPMSIPAKSISLPLTRSPDDSLSSRAPLPRRRRAGSSSPPPRPFPA